MIGGFTIGLIISQYSKVPMVKICCKTSLSLVYGFWFGTIYYHWLVVINHSIVANSRLPIEFDDNDNAKNIWSLVLVYNNGSYPPFTTYFTWWLNVVDNRYDDVLTLNIDGRLLLFR